MFTAEFSFSRTIAIAHEALKKGDLKKAKILLGQTERWVEDHSPMKKAYLNKREFQAWHGKCMKDLADLKNAVIAKENLFQANAYAV